ncbi:gamma-mobile-trio protein GmtX [Paraburkholderia sp. 22099]|uniref:gamma-mobile-trio protein GmtX n=1 Tax=Paraburkholderia sp. 22099 TaxID=3453875 RepID=UPI003F830CBF
MTKQYASTSVDILRDARQLYQMRRNMATKSSKVENLDKLWEVLKTIQDEGGRDYSLAEVGRRLEKLDGPKTQSLRNIQGAHYREIITAYANAVSGATRYVAKTKSNVEQALALVTDPSIRSILRVALDEAKRLKVVNDNLHAAFKTFQVGTALPKVEIPVAAETQRPSLTNENAPAALSPRLLNALRKGLDKTRLAQQGLQVAIDGSVQNDHGDKLFPPSFATAIQAILDNHGVSASSRPR